MTFEPFNKMGGFSWVHFLSPITNLFKSKPNPEIKAIKDADHTYIRGHESQRSPCPFLNALANHNYLYVTAGRAKLPHTKLI